MNRSIFIVCSLLIPLSIQSQDITGTWHGLRAYPNFEMRMILHIQKDGATYTANYDSPDRNFFEISLDPVRFEDNVLSFYYAAAEVSFLGVYNEEKGEINGIYKYSQGSFPLTLTRDSLDVPDQSMAFILDNYSKEEMYIPMRDGTRLFTSVYHPKDQSQDYPILLLRTPYNSESNEENYSNRLYSMYHLLQEGYIMVFQDVRGRYMSEGEFVDVRPFVPNKRGKQFDENSDTYDSIDWLIKNVRGNNGNVGIFGISYPGFYSTMALPEAHPALKAASPQAPVLNWFIGDDWHHNGAFFLMDAFSFYSSVGRPRPEVTRSSPTPYEWQNEDNYDFFLDIGPIKNVRQKYFGDSIQFWSDLMTHPNYDEFWKVRDLRPHLTNVKPAVLTVGGWFDAEDLYGPLRTYEAIEKQNPSNDSRLIMGPWSHGQWAGGNADNLGNIYWGSNTSDYFKDVERKFFNHYLKNEGPMDLPEANIFITGSNQWKSFDQWPPVEVTTTNLYLEEKGGLSLSPPNVDQSYDEYQCDPNKPVPYTEDVHFGRTTEYLTDDQRFASRRQDVMTYNTETLQENITLVGPIQVNLYASTTGTDADYVVKIIDVFPDEVDEYPENDKEVPIGGYQMLVRGEVLRGRYRNSFERPEPFVPGQVTEVSFEIPDLAHTFKVGHKIMVQIQNSWFPLVDRNPQQFVNIYECDEEDFIKATHRVYHDATRPSHISVRALSN
ncbi:MAG: CocE/NonD family hydrolase [Saprospiraceae bacterium]|nr:CocE/NonD family hydrolase [Saprospiraceae bacterium]